MSTPNFETMRNFPLFIWEVQTPEQAELDEYEMDETDYIQMEYDDQTMYMKEVIKELTDKTPLQFHDIEIKSGYYSGLQLYVNDNKDGYGIPEENDNYTCNMVWNTCRSKAIRAYKSEVNKVKKILKEIAKRTGMTQLECIGIFSNGEAVYRKVEG